MCKRFKPLLLILTSVMLTPVNLSATTYYVSNSGNDDASGKSPASAWQTIAKLNSVSFSAGDSILFEAGGLWRETLQIRQSGTEGKYIVFSRFGNGKNPVIYGSEPAGNWTATGTPNIWQSGTPLDNYSDEYYAGRIFFLNNDSVSWGQYREYNAGFLNLIKEFDYTVNGSQYYVYSPADPNNRYDFIEVTQRQRCISIPDNQPQSYIEINGIDFKFSRLAGFDSGYPAQRGAKNLVFRNCTLGYIGAQPSGYAYGIAAWHSDFLVENCTITDCGRRGISINLYLQMPAGEQRNISNIIIRNNVFKRGYHTTALDLSSQMTNNDTIQNVFFYNNYIDDSEFDEICDGCGSNQVFFQNGEGSALLNNIYIVGNIFVQSTARNILFEGEDTSYVWNNSIVGHNTNITENPYQNAGWNSDKAVVNYQNNILYDNLPDNFLQNHGVFIYSTHTGKFNTKDYNLYYSLFPKNDRNFSAHRLNSTGPMGYWRTTEWNDYLTENPSFEQNSPVPANPEFIDFNNKNYRLSHLSPAIAKGLATPWIIITDPFGVDDTINKYDIDGKEFSVSNWDIGAYSYSATDSTANEIVTIYIPGQTGTATINSSNHTITVEVAYGTDITDISPVIGVSKGAQVSPASGVSCDFSSPQVYTVTSLNGINKQGWTVTVTVAETSYIPESGHNVNFNLYPNPACDFLKISANNPVPEVLVIKLFNIQGVLVYKNQLSDCKNIITLPLKEFIPGVYYIVISNNKELTETRKLIIQK